MKLQFRFKPQRSIEDIEPSRIEAVLAHLQQIESFKIYDDRASDASFVTLVVTLAQFDTADLAALQRALTAIARVRAFAVDPAGKETPLLGLAADELAYAARVGPKP